MSLFNRVPVVVKKWLPREGRNTINRYRPRSISPQTDIGVRIEVSAHEKKFEVMLTLEYFPVRAVEYLNPLFRGTEVDWAELVEVAAWTIAMENQEHIALVKQLVSQLGNNIHMLHLEPGKCTSYRILKNLKYHPLKQVVFS